MERAIRSAFEKGDPGDPEFRKRIYRSALNALDKAISGDAALSPDLAAIRRESMKAVIRRVETEFKPATAPDVETESVATRKGPFPAHTNGAAAPSVELREKRTPHPARKLAPKATESVAEKVPAPPRKLRPNRIFGLPFLIGCLILAATATYLYRQYGTAPVAAPVVIKQGVDGAESTGGVANQEWIDIFAAADPATNVQALSGVELEMVDQNEQKALRINAKGSKDASVSFEVGPGILAQLAGKQAIFELAARSQEGKSVQIAIECDFGTLGDCGRRRYEVVFTPFNYLFEVLLAEGAVETAGKIVLTPDTAGSGAYLDLSRIRVTMEAAQ
jgi:hypothetical protein